MKVYIAGPMTGLPDYNYPAFHKAAAGLRELGMEVFNPAEHFDGDQTLPKTTYMSHDLNVIINDVDLVVTLPGWAKSTGASLEVAVAKACGIPVLRYDWMTRLSVAVLVGRP